MLRGAVVLPVLAAVAALMLGLLGSTAVPRLAQAASPAEEWFVSQSGTGSFGNGTSCAAPDVVGSDDTAIRTVLNAATFDDTVTICNGVYSITQTLIVDDSITIQGQSTSGSILDGGNTVQIMRINDDDSTAGDPLEVRVLVTDLTFRNGNTGFNGTDSCNTRSQCGGAIYVEYQSDLTVLRSYFVDNFASFQGGAIANAGDNGVGGQIRIESSTFQTNASQVDAGAFGVVGNYGVGIQIINSTFVRNRAIGRAGGSVSINFSDQAVIASSSFVDDRAGDQGQSIYANADVTMQGNLIASGGSGNPCALSNNVTDDASVSTGPGCATAQVVTRDSLNLLGLGDWGGPTPTVWIGPGSSAENANAGTCQPVDQRGATRSAPPCDAGAYERRGPNDEGTTGTLDYTSPLAMDDTALPTSSPTPSPPVVGRTIGYKTLSGDICAVDAASGEVTPRATGDCQIQWYLAPTTTADGAADDDSMTITKAAQAPLVIDPIAQPVVYGTSVSMSTTGGSGSGSVVFAAGASTGCYVPWWIDPTLLIIANAEGTCTVTATKDGTPVYDPVTSASVSVALAKAPQTPLTIQVPTSLEVATTTTLTTTGGSTGQTVDYSASPASVCVVAADQLTMLDAGTCIVSATMPGDTNYLAVNAADVNVEAIPLPPAQPASPPQSVTATVSGTSVEVAWQEPSSSGDFPISTYQVVSQPSGGSCLVAAPARFCRIDSLPAGASFTFEARALTGAGWSGWSQASNRVTIPRQSEQTIVITGSRGGGRINVSGSTTGFGAGAVLRPWVRLEGQLDFARGSARILVDESGRFTWSRRQGRLVQVYIADQKGDVTSNIVGFRPRPSR